MLARSSGRWPKPSLGRAVASVVHRSRELFACCADLAHSRPIGDEGFDNVIDRRWCRFDDREIEPGGVEHMRSDRVDDVPNDDPPCRHRFDGSSAV